MRETDESTNDRQNHLNFRCLQNKSCNTNHRSQLFKVTFTKVKRVRRPLKFTPTFKQFAMGGENVCVTMSSYFQTTEGFCMNLANSKTARHRHRSSDSNADEVAFRYFH